MNAASSAVASNAPNRTPEPAPTLARTMPAASVSAPQGATRPVRNPEIDEIIARYKAARVGLLGRHARGRKVYKLPIGPAPRIIARLVYVYPIGPNRPNEPQIAKRIIADVAAKHGVRVADIVGPCQIRKFVRARQEAAWRINKAFPRYSLGMIGRLLGGRDHTTALHSIKQHQRWIDEGKAVAA